MQKKCIMGWFFAGSFLAIASFSFMGCQSHEGSKEQMENAIDSFATHYYNWHFAEALKYCTPTSERWLRYMASNVHEEDIDLLRSKEEDATIEINDIDFHDDEVTATARITISNFLQMDTIGQAAHLIEQATFPLQLEMQQGKWKVNLDAARMANLPQNGKRSRD